MRTRSKVSIMALLATVIAGAMILGSACMKPPFCDGRFHDYMMGRLDKKVAELKLSPDQQKKYEELKVRLKSDWESRQKDRQAMLDMVKSELAKPNPDMKALGAKAKERMDSGHQGMSKHVDAFLEFYEVLNAEQKTKANAFILEKLEHGPCHH